MNEVKKVTTLNQLVAFCTDSIIDNKKSRTKKDYICSIMIIFEDIQFNKKISIEKSNNV
jgi:hypothetical protein